MNKYSIQSNFKNGILVSVSLLIALLLVSSCAKRTDFIGSELVTMPEGFFVADNSFSASPDRVNFERDKAKFSAEFSHRVTWRIKLQGLTSGANKVIKGTSDKLDPDSIQWNGSHDGLYFFMRDEKVLAELTFMGGNLTLIDTIDVLRAKLYGNQGFSVSNDSRPTTFEGFEGASFNISGLFWLDPYFDGRREMAERDPMLNDKDKPVQGEYAFTLSGTDITNSYFVGGFKRNITAMERNAIKWPEDPDSVYINIYLYGRGDGVTKLNFSMEEADDGGPSHREDRHDAFEFQFNFEHTGWKLFSVRYSDLTRAANPDYGGSGNNVKEPNKVRSIAFNAISSPPNNYVKATFDFPIITFGKPFNPRE
ncbi:MAG: hypothetical protein ACK4ND_12700 [Cytophagaceae bacterium]